MYVNRKKRSVKWVHESNEGKIIAKILMNQIQSINTISI